MQIKVLSRRNSICHRDLPLWTNAWFAHSLWQDSWSVPSTRNCYCWDRSIQVWSQMCYEEIYQHDSRRLFVAVTCLTCPKSWDLCAWSCNRSLVGPRPQILFLTSVVQAWSAHRGGQALSLRRATSWVIAFLYRLFSPSCMIFSGSLEALYYIIINSQIGQILNKGVLGFWGA